LDLSNHTNVSDMELTSGMQWKKAHNTVEMNRNVSDRLLTSEGPQREIFNPLDASNCTDVSDMELTSGMQWKEAHKTIEMNRNVSNMALTSEGPQKEFFNPLDVSSNGNVNDMELTSEVKWKRTHNAVEMNRHINDVSLTGDGPQREIFNPLDASNHANVSDMELTSGMQWKEAHKTVEMNRHVSDRALMHEGPQREIFNPLDASNCTDVSDMELTSGMQWKEAYKAVEMNRHVSDMALTSEGQQREIFNPLDSSKCANVSDMELTSGTQWKKTHNTVEMNRNVSDRALMSEGPQREIFNPLGASNSANVSDMELTNGMQWEKTYNAIEMNRNVSDMALTSEGPQKEFFNPLDASNHTNVSDMELTSGMQWKKTRNAIDMNRHACDMSLTIEGPQKEIFNPLDASNDGNVSYMELTSGVKWEKMCKLGEANQSVTDMEIRIEKKCKQTYSPIDMSSRNKVSDMELRSVEKGEEIYNVGDLSDMEQSDRREMARSAVCADVDDLRLRNEVMEMNMELSGVNLKGINNQSHVFRTHANSSNTENIHFVQHKQKDIHTDTCSETKNISGIPTMLEVPKLSINQISNIDGKKLSKHQISNIDGKKLSKHREIGDIAGMSYHPLQPMNIKQSDIAMLLHNNDSEDTKQQCELEVHISPCGDTHTDKTCQSDHGQAKRSLRHTILSEESTVETLDNREKFCAQDSSLTVVNQVEDQYNLPFSKVSPASTKGRYCEQGMSEVEGINESGCYKSREPKVGNHTSAKSSVPAVGLNLSNPLNTKDLGNKSNECDILKLNEGSVNRNIKNTADRSEYLQGTYNLENLDSSSKKLMQVSPTCQIASRITKGNLNMHQQLSEGSTYTLCATGAIKELAMGFDSVSNASSSNTNSVGNAASHDIQEVHYARKRVHEKTHSQDTLVENAQMFNSHNTNSYLLEEVDGKQRHADMKAASYECLEAGDLHLQTPPELQAFLTVEQPRNVTPANSTEPVEINQNLSYLEIENTSIPEEPEFNVTGDLSPETDESYKKLLECVLMADECVHEKLSMISNEIAMLGNGQSTEQNYKNRTSILEELKNNENTLNEPVITAQKGSPDGTSVKSSSKQMCEHSEPQKLRKDANEDVTTASVQEKIKEEELRLVINCDLPCSMSDVMACLISTYISGE